MTHILKTSSLYASEMDEYTFASSSSLGDFPVHIKMSVGIHFLAASCRLIVITLHTEEN